MRKILSVIAFVALLIAAAVADQAAEGMTGFVRVSADGNGFVVDGKPWHPFGCNYFDPHVGWAPRLWQRFDAEEVEKHFQAMRDLNVNVVRVFLTAQSFFPNPPNLEPDALKKFDTLLSIARRYGIRVHPTGPDHWEGTPAWRRSDFYADDAALEAQVAFWKAFAARYRDEPIIFAYDLLNEPHIRWNGSAMERQWRDWLRRRYGQLEALRKSWGDEAEKIEFFDAVSAPPDKAAPNSAALQDYQRFRESVAEQWVKCQADAIRAVDPNHLVTVGFIQWVVPVRHGEPARYAAFRPSQIAPLVDFLSIHFYPLWGDPHDSPEHLDRNLAYLEFVLRYVRAGAPNKPLVVGEFGWYGGGKPADRPTTQSAEGQSRWCRAAVLQGRGIAAGWLNWAYADTPSSRDVSKFSGLVTEDGKPKAWGEAFRQLADNPSSWTIPTQRASAEIEFDAQRAMVDPASGDAALQRYYEAWKRQRLCGLQIK